MAEKTSVTEVKSNSLFDEEIAKLENKLKNFRETPAYDSGCRLAQTEERLATFRKAKRMLVKWNKSNARSHDPSDSEVSVDSVVVRGSGREA